MKIGRILRDGQEEYGILRQDLWYPQMINRSDLGIEEYFNSNIEFRFETAISLENENYQWLPPIARPGKILCVGRNYAEHSREQGKKPESTPLIFSKFSTCLVGHQSVVSFPSHTDNLDYEVELAVIIGKEVPKLSSPTEAWSYVFGYTVANDLTARDVQKSENQWTRGKGFDSSLPIGPLIVTTEEIDKPENNQIWLNVNGEERQSSNTDHMIFSIPYLIHYLSQVITLETGDIILTGTPEGVGYYMDPKKTLEPGDKVECGVKGIGTLGFVIDQR